MNKIKSILICFLIVQMIQAQWAIKKSDLPGSHLEQTFINSAPLVHVIPDKEWEESNFASPQDLEWYKEAKYGMFITFGLSTLKNKEISWSHVQRVMPDFRVDEAKVCPSDVWTHWADSLSLTKFNKKELVDIIHKSGIKYLVIVAKHHDGFHFWDTNYSDFKITHTPYGKDLIWEIVDACKLAGIKIGIYYSQRDWYHPDYEPIDTMTIHRIKEPPFYKAKEGMTPQVGKKHQKYIDYQFNVVRELCTNYGKIDLFWFDAVYFNGMFTANMWDAEKLTRMIRELQPSILINNRASLPGDFDSPEGRIGMFQNNRPWETCMTLCQTWSYSPTPVKTPLEVFQKLQSTAIGDGNFLLSWGMKWDGDWDETQKQSFLGTGTYLKKYGESIYNTQGGPWLPNEWGGSTFRGNKIYIHIVRKPDTDIFFLPKLKGIDIENSKVCTGQHISITKRENGYVLNLQQIKMLDSPLIVELTASRIITKSDVQDQIVLQSLFSDQNTYGNVLTSGTLHSKQTFIIDLHQIREMKGLLIKKENYKKNVSVKISLSINGNQWAEHKTLCLPTEINEIPITRIEAGSWIEGVKAQKIKLEFSEEISRPFAYSVYGL